ncbi:MAG: IS66 family insertion sequence element accessory protein TnpA [Gammaproteobacteria bacterium]
MALSQQWLEQIEAWERSGIKQSAYCRQHDLNPRTFAAR